MRADPVDLREGTLAHRVYDEILRPAFPPDELDAREGFLEAVGTGSAVGIALVDADRAPLSAVVGYPYAGARVLLIGHLATRERLRSRGLGARLLDLAVERWHAPDRYDLVLAEVEDPRYNPGDDAVRRLSFYTGRGATLLERPYFQPRLPTRSDRRYGLLLIVLAAAGGAVSGGAVAGRPVVAFLRAYFEDCEGPVGDDPQLGALLAAYEASALIPTRELSSYREIAQIQPPGGEPDRSAEPDA